MIRVLQILSRPSNPNFVTSVRENVLILLFPLPSFCISRTCHHGTSELTLGKVTSATSVVTYRPLINLSRVIDASDATPTLSSPARKPRFASPCRSTVRCRSRRRFALHPSTRCAYRQSCITCAPALVCMTLSKLISTPTSPSPFVRT